MRNLHKVVLVPIIGIALANCSTTPKPTAAEALPPDKVAASGLSIRELSDLEVFLEFFYNDFKSPHCKFSPPLKADDWRTLPGHGELHEIKEPAFVWLTADHGVELGLAYDRMLHKLTVIPVSKLGPCNAMLFKRTPYGYYVEEVEGCLHYAFQLKTKAGLPMRVYYGQEDRS